MKQHKFKLSPTAIAALLAIAAPLLVGPANAAAPARKTPEIAHNAADDKPKAANAVKNSRASRSALHSAVTTMETTRQTLRKKP